MTGAPKPHRIGEPSPLIFHLSVALQSYMNAVMAAPRAASPNFPWHDELRGEARQLAPAPHQVDVALEMVARLRAMCDGIDLWQCHDFERAVVEPPVLWRCGSARLLDYGQSKAATAPDGPPVLVVPSLINRAYILDLLPRQSLLRGLARSGLRPILLDWGAPDAKERGFDLDAYGQKRLLPALEACVEMTARPAALLGYCMGGTLATGIAACRPDLVTRLVTVGAPWDFSSDAGMAGLMRTAIRREGPERVRAMLRTSAEAFGVIPVGLFQALFSIVNPMQAAIKFQKFARFRQDGPAAQLFVALEDWLADGVPMAGPAAEDLLIGWQIENRTMRGKWRFMDREIRLDAVRSPTFCVIGTRDGIAPPVLSLPLAQGIRGASVATPDLGHIGMIVGSRARRQVWSPVARFLGEEAC